MPCLGGSLWVDVNGLRSSAGVNIWPAVTSERFPCGEINPLLFVSLGSYVSCLTTPTLLLSGVLRPSVPHMDLS
jgi:hypothetical protein